MDNIERHYEFYTQGCADDAPVVLFLPGVGCSALIFHEALPYFMPDYKVVLFNNPGLNRTKIPVILTIDDIVARIKKVLDHLDIKKCHVIGHSMGGFSAQKLALEYPEMVDKLVLVGTSYGGPQNMLDVKRTSKDLGMNIMEYRKTLRDDPAKIFRHTFSPVVLEKEPQKFDRFMQLRKRNWGSIDVVLRHLACGTHFSSYMEIHRVRQETLVIHGQDDWVVAPEAGEKLAQQLPHAHFWKIPACGHFPFIEKDDFYARIVDFLAGAQVGEKLPHDPPPDESLWHKVKKKLHF